MRLKIIVMLCLIAHMSGCGSLRTVVASNEDIARDLKRNKTHCSVSTRIYSGVTYDFCRFNAEPQGSYYNNFIAAYFILDIALLSPVVDTVLLPVSIPQQIIYGNPKIE